MLLNKRRYFLTEDRRAGDFSPLSLKKYGVVRDPANDFSDDGNRFRAYLYKDVVPITYLRDGDDVYLSIAFHHLGDINYEEYREFPSYKNVNKYNGVNINEVDPEDFIKICEEAFKDINNFRENVKSPDRGAYEKYLKTYADYYKKQIEKARDLIANNLEKVADLSSYRLERLFEYYNDIRRLLKTYSKGSENVSDVRIRNALSDSSLYRQKEEIAEDCFYLKEIEKLINE